MRRVGNLVLMTNTNYIAIKRNDQCIRRHKVAELRGFSLNKVRYQTRKRKPIQLADYYQPLSNFSKQPNQDEWLDANSNPVTWEQVQSTNTYEEAK